MRRPGWGLGLALLVLLGAGCKDAPKVLQGTVVRYEAPTQTLVVRDELPPYREFFLSLEKAELGAEPRVGDVVRIAYRETVERRVAIRVMNLTRQMELSMPVR